MTTVVEPGRRRLGNRYELHELIASGGMGQVWRGSDLALGRPVAVKVLRSEYTGDPTFVARFRAEAQLSASLSHPNVARVFDYGETAAQDGSGETLAYLVMELVDGEPLSSVLRREGRLDTVTTLRLLRQAAFALAEAHRTGMVHRDVKPGNILVCADGSLKITDFGIAWSARSVPLTRTGQVIGTPQYLSPEQAEGHQAAPASDVYALGLVGYECLTGRTAFDGDNAVTIALKQVRQDPEPLPDDLPPGVRTLIGRALAKDPRARYPDGGAFLAAIDDALDGRGGPATIAVRRPAAVRRPPGRRGTTDAGSPAAAREGRTAARRRVLPLLVPLLALLTGAGIAAGVVYAVIGDPSAPTAVAAQTQDNATFRLDPTDYVGRPVDEVAVQLAARGLTVRRLPEATGSATPGTVLGVSPADEPLSAGDRVTLTYAVAPPSTDVRVRRPAPPSREAPAPTTPVTRAVGSESTPAPESGGAAAGSTAPSTQPGGGSSAPSSTPPTADPSTTPPSTTGTTTPSSSAASTSSTSSASSASSSRDGDR